MSSHVASAGHLEGGHQQNEGGHQQKEGGHQQMQWWHHHTLVHVCLFEGGVCSLDASAVEKEKP